VVLRLDLYGALLQLADDTGKPRATLVVPSEGQAELALLGKGDAIVWCTP